MIQFTGRMFFMMNKLYPTICTCTLHVSVLFLMYFLQKHFALVVPKGYHLRVVRVMMMLIGAKVCVQSIPLNLSCLLWKCVMTWLGLQWMFEASLAPCYRWRLIASFSCFSWHAFHTMCMCTMWDSQVQASWLVAVLGKYLVYGSFFEKKAKYSSYSKELAFHGWTKNLCNHFVKLHHLHCKLCNRTKLWRFWSFSHECSLQPYRRYLGYSRNPFCTVQDQHSYTCKPDFT